MQSTNPRFARDSASLRCICATNSFPLRRIVWQDN